MKYTAKNDTLLKKSPVQGSTLTESEKIVVSAGTEYIIQEVIGSDGLHSHVEIETITGSWWIFLPHWDTDSGSGEVNATFSLKSDNVNSLIYGSLVFIRGGTEVLRVKATSGQSGHQYSGAHTVPSKGYLPPGNNWKISTKGYYSDTPGIEGMFYHITPDPDPNTKRSEFGLHRDANMTNFPGSAGCIVVFTSDFNNKVRPLLDGLNQSHVSLSVNYN